MFWRFVNPTGSNFEALLTRDPPPLLEDLLDDGDLLTECKTQNAKLMEVLGRPDMVRGLFGWVTKGLEPRSPSDDTDTERQRRQRFRQLAAEVLCSEAWTITETTLASPDEFLRPFWEAILGPPPAGAQKSTDAAPEIASGKVEERPALETANSDSKPDDTIAECRMSSDDSSSTDVDLTDDSTEEKPMDLEDESPAVVLPVVPSVPEPAKAEGWHPAAVAKSGTAGDESSEDEFEEVQDDASDKPDEEPSDLDLVDNEREVIHGQWSRVNSHFLGKKTAEMLGFIRMQPAIVERLLANITSPAVVDLLIRIIQCEDNADGQGVLGWLSTEQLIPRLTDLLAPSHSPATHEAAAELLKGIIIMSAPAPTPFASVGQANGGGGGEQNGAVGGSRNNKFARELVSDEHVRKLVGFMLEPALEPALSEESTEVAMSPARGGETTPTQRSSDLLQEAAVTRSSSLIAVISIFIELIRKNNSDYSEPHLFHTLRNGLMSHSTTQASKALLAGENEMDDEVKEAKDRVELEEKMEDLNASLGIVHLGNLLAVLSGQIGELRRRLSSAPIAPEAGVKPALTLERFRIIELFAELLHCSNMAVLNRPVGTGPKYDQDGQLMGGLAGLDVLNGALNGTDEESEDDDDSDADDESLSAGDVLKQKIMDHGLLGSLLDLFLEFPLNNFLHSSVYDVVQQILSSRLEQGLNQALIVHLFKTSGLVTHLLEGQRRQGESSIRLGYMGHLVLIAEDVLKFLSDCPDDLKAFLTPTYDGAAWDAFVTGPYAAAKAKDNSTMGGGKPVVNPLIGGSGSALDDGESDSDEEITEQMDTSGNGSSQATGSNGTGNASEMFSRYMAQQIGSSTTDRQFESSSDDDDEEDSEWMADRHSFQPTATVPSSTSRLDPFGTSSAFDDDDWGVFQSTPSADGGTDDPFGDDFASAGPSTNGGPNSEALAALEWNDATFQAEFRDFDSEDDDGAVGPSSFGSSSSGGGSGGRIHIPDAGADSDEEMSFTPTAASAQWSRFNASADDDDIDAGSSRSGRRPTSTSPQSIPSFGGPAGNDKSPVSPSTAAPLSHLSLSSSPVSSFHLPSAAASIFTPMSAISPPDPSLLETVSERSPLGPGVGRDVRTVTQISPAGITESKLEKIGEDGERIVVPKDEIALAVETEAEGRQAKSP